MNEWELPAGALAFYYEYSSYIVHSHFLATMDSTWHNDSKNML